MAHPLVDPKSDHKPTQNSHGSFILGVLLAYPSWTPKVITNQPKTRMGASFLASSGPTPPGPKSDHKPIQNSHGSFIFGLLCSQPRLPNVDFWIFLVFSPPLKSGQKQSPIKRFGASFSIWRPPPYFCFCWGQRLNPKSDHKPTQNSHGSFIFGLLLLHPPSRPQK